MPPFDLVQQGAMVDFVDLMQRAQNTNVSNAHIFQSDIVDPGIPASTDFALDNFVASPSPVPTPGNEFSDPDPFVAQAEFQDNGFGGLILRHGPRPDNTDLDLLGSLNQSSVDALSGPTTQDITSSGLRPADPFGTPNPDRTRDILRRLFDTV